MKKTQKDLTRFLGDSTLNQSINQSINQSKERWNKYLCKCSSLKPKGDEGLLINLISLGGVV